MRHAVDDGDRSGFDNDRGDITVYNIGDDDIDVNNKDSDFEITISDKSLARDIVS